MRLIYDTDLGIEEMIRICTSAAEERGWHDKPITFSDAIALLHSEISEAYEEYRKNKDYNEVYISEGGKPEGISIEFADLAIRLFHYCGYFNIDLVGAIKNKLKYNKTRSYRHGNKKS